MHATGYVMAKGHLQTDRWHLSHAMDRACPSPLLSWMRRGKSSASSFPAPHSATAPATACHLGPTCLDAHRSLMGLDPSPARMLTSTYQCRCHHLLRGCAAGVARKAILSSALLALSSTRAATSFSCFLRRLQRLAPLRLCVLLLQLSLSRLVMRLRSAGSGCLSCRPPRESICHLNP